MHVGGEAPAFRQLVRRQLGDEVFEGPAVAEKSEAGQRTGGQQPAEEIQRLGPGRRLPSAVGLAWLDRKARPDRLCDRLDHAAVSGEKRICRRLILGVGAVSYTPLTLPTN